MISKFNSDLIMCQLFLHPNQLYNIAINGWIFYIYLYRLVWPSRSRLTLQFPTFEHATIELFVYFDTPVVGRIPIGYHTESERTRKCDTSFRRTLCLRLQNNTCSGIFSEAVSTIPRVLSLQSFRQYVNRIRRTRLVTKKLQLALKSFDHFLVRPSGRKISCVYYVYIYILIYHDTILCTSRRRLLKKKIKLKLNRQQSNVVNYLNSHYVCWQTFISKLYRNRVL